MHLTRKEEGMLAGEQGFAAKKSMEVLVALGEIYGAEALAKVSSTQLSGVSYKSLGDAGIEFLNELAEDGRVRVKTTLNPAGMDLLNWRRLGIDDEFARAQLSVVDAYRRLGATISCTCTPYLAGNRPRLGEHVAWSESSAVAFANSVLGARTNREGGPSALAAALTGRTPLYGYHLEENRHPTLVVNVETKLGEPEDFAALGYHVGGVAKQGVPFFRGVGRASLEGLKSLSAALASSGGVALFHVEGVTPEAGGRRLDHMEQVSFGVEELRKTIDELNDPASPDFICIGCPHCSLAEVAAAARLLKGRRVSKEFWVCCSREVRRQSDRRGYSKVIEESGAKIACDTCMVVAPVDRLGFKTMATNSAKACHYTRNLNRLNARFWPLERCVEEAVKGD